MYHEIKGSGAFGGLMLENICQALCRDIFVEGMLRLEAAGYSIVMHTHDDYVVEFPDDSGSLEEFVGLITTPPSWAPDLPIAAKARISDRFIEIPEPAKIAAVAADNALDNAAEDLREEATAIASTEPAEKIEDGCNGSDAQQTLDRLAPEIAAGAPIIGTAPELAAEAGIAEGDVTAAAMAPFMIPRAVSGQRLEQGCCEPASGEPPWSGEAGAPIPLDSGTSTSAAAELIRAKMWEQGADWTAAPSPSPPPSPSPIPPPSPAPPPPIAAKSNGSQAAAVIWPARSNGWDDYGRGEESAGSPTADEYIYRTADKKMHMRVVRTAAKQFPTYHWENGAWVIGWPKTVVPYKLPELLEAPGNRGVLICEGEKDCDTAVRHGFIATTSPGGAGKWRDELSQYFKGRPEVCIVEDNDPPGARHTASIIKALTGVVPNIGVLRFPELKSGGDLTDYFDAGGTRPYLLGRIEQAMKAGVAQSAELDVYDAGDLLSGAAPPPRQWLIKAIFLPHVPVRPGGARRRRQDHLAARPRRSSWQPGGNCWASASTPARGCWCLFRGRPQRAAPPALGNLQTPRHRSGGIEGLAVLPQPEKGLKLAELDAKGRRRQIGALDGMLRRAIERYATTWSMLDPFVKLHALNENDNPDMDFVCELLIDHRAGLQHRHRQPGAHPQGEIAAGDADARRGASAQRDAGRLDYTLTAMSEEEARQFGIGPDERKPYVRLDKAKANMVRATEGGLVSAGQRAARQCDRPIPTATRSRRSSAGPAGNLGGDRRRNAQRHSRRASTPGWRTDSVIPDKTAPRTGRLGGGAEALPGQNRSAVPRDHQTMVRRRSAGRDRV